MLPDTHSEGHQRRKPSVAERGILVAKRAVGVKRLFGGQHFNTSVLQTMCPADSELLKSLVASDDAGKGHYSMIFEFAAPVRLAHGLYTPGAAERHPRTAAMSRQSGFVPIRRGLWEHLRDGRMSPLVCLAFIYICSQADTRTGIWKGSAGALVGELGLRPRTARDVLERLEHGDYIRRFLRPGERLCYPILVHKFPLTQGEHIGEVVDALSSLFSDGRLDLKYFPCEVDGEVHFGVYGEGGASQRRSKNREKRQEKKTDHPRNDDAGRSLTSLREKAKAKLLQERPEEAAFLEAALQMIEVRAHNSNCNPRTVGYFVTAYKNLKESDRDWKVVEHVAKSPQSTDNLSKLNSLTLKAEREAARTGRDFFECFYELRQNPSWFEEAIA